MFKVALLAALALLLAGNSGGRAAVGGHGATGAPGETGALCVGCHNGGPYGALIELLEITKGGQLVATYDPGQTYDVKFTVAAGAGNPAGYGFQLTALDNARANVGAWQGLGNNVKESAAVNTGGRKYLEHKGGASVGRVFTAKWVAPAKGAGDVDFYYIGAAVNGNGAQTGDNAGLGSSLTLSERKPGRLLPYFEDFDFGDGGWMSYPDPGATSPSSWEHGTPAGQTITGAFSGAGAWVTGAAGPYNHGELSYLESPPIDLSAAAVDPIVQFAIAYDAESGADGAWLEVSTNGGAGWWSVGWAGSGPGWYDSASLVCGDWWSGYSGGWQLASHSLDGTAGMSDVRLRFVFSSDGSIAMDGVAIDDVSIAEPEGPGPDPTEEPDGGPWPEADGGPWPGPDAGPQPQADGGPWPEPDAGPWVEVDAGPMPGPDAGPMPGPDAGTMPGPDAGTMPGPDATEEPLPPPEP